MKLLIVDALLVALALLTVGLAHTDLHGWNSTVALSIATVKASLIALFFMEVRLAGPLPRLVGAASVAWLGLLMVGTLTTCLPEAGYPRRAIDPHRRTARAVADAGLVILEGRSALR